MGAKTPMTKREQQIWDAAYAAYFVGEFRAIKKLHERVGGVHYPFDRAAEGMNAEAAILVADLAVLRLRAWREDEDLSAGETVEMWETSKEPGR